MTVSEIKHLFWKTLRPTTDNKGRSVVRKVYVDHIIQEAKEFLDSDSLQVLAWPSPPEEGVLCRKGFPKGVRVGPDGFAVEHEAGWRQVGRSEDSPIREAWERLCEQSQPRNSLGVKISEITIAPPDGLYLFVEFSLQVWMEYGDQLPGLGQLLPVEDVTELWREEASVLACIRPPATMTTFERAQAVLEACGAQSLRFTSATETRWVDRQLMEGV